MSILWPSPNKVAVLTTVQGDFVAVVNGDDAYVEQVRSKIEESLDGVRIVVAPERGSFYKKSPESLWSCGCLHDWNCADNNALLDSPLKEPR